MMQSKLNILEDKFKLLLGIKGSIAPVFRIISSYLEETLKGGNAYYVIVHLFVTSVPNMKPDQEDNLHLVWCIQTSSSARREA